MAYDSAVRPGLQPTGASSQPGSGSGSAAAPAAQSGSRVKPAASAETARPVSAAGGMVTSAPAGAAGAPPDRGAALTAASEASARPAASPVQASAFRVDFPGAAAEARIEAAERAYMMTLRAAGVSAISGRLGR